jgi:hypothetical protein
MSRITQKDLEYLVLELNRSTGKPIEPYTKQSDGSFKSNTGCYILDYAYGGVALNKLVTDGGGVMRISKDGYGTKRQLHDFIVAILTGMTISGR